MAINLEKTPLQVFSRRLVNIKFIQFIQNDLDKLENIDNMLNKKHYLSQTYIIHLVSHWQVFIEELIKYGFYKLLKKVNEGNGIQSFINVLEKNYQYEIKKFNTPNCKSIDRIFENTIGIKSISNKFEWDKMSRDKAVQKLDEILQIRHRIAHTGYSQKELFIEENFSYMKHMYNLAYILQYAISSELCEDLRTFEIPHPENLF